MRLAAAVCIVASAATASAKALDFVAPGCPPRVVTEAASILDVELRTTASAATPARQWRVTLQCSPSDDSIALEVGQAGSAVHSATVVALGDVSVSSRSRVIALALAEMIRDLEIPTKSRAASTTLSPPAGPQLPAQRPIVARPSRPRPHVTRDLALGLAVVACAALATGAVLTARDNDHGEHKGPDGSEAASGVSFSLGGVTFLGSSVNFALWWRDRARPVPEDPSVANPGASSVAPAF
ncbi:MAG TPA: hypothetical protein VGL86_08270 [Polyangia bacterium]